MAPRPRPGRLAPRRAGHASRIVFPIEPGVRDCIRYRHLSRRCHYRPAGTGAVCPPVVPLGDDPLGTGTGAGAGPLAPLVAPPGLLAGAGGTLIPIAVGAETRTVAAPAIEFTVA